MKRLHVSLGVEDLDASIRFYNTLFGAEPSVQREGYAKWMLDDPRINFVLNQRGSQKGVDHLGIQVEDEAELAATTARLKAAGEDLLELQKTQCCFAVSDKTWVRDPQGVPWETFKTHYLADEFGAPDMTEATLPRAPVAGKAKACCG